MSSIQRICSVENCDKYVTCRGWCNPHYQRWVRYSDPLGSRPMGTHGMSESPEFRTWASIKTRCYNPKADNYARYGGAGVTVCDRWLNSFENFYEDMGPKPTPKHTIDRIKGDMGYEPGNCRWITNLQQSWNKGIRKNNTSGYIGVCRHDNKWVAKIELGQDRYNRDNFFIGYYDDVQEAAIAYDQAAIFFRGEYAVTNFI